MLWGAAMAVGAESFRMYSDDRGQAIAVAITATQHLMESFINSAKSIECEEITETDFSNKWSFAKYLFSGKFYSCFKLAEKWAPDAIEAASAGVSIEQAEFTRQPISCASEVIKKMGGSEEEMVMVAGFAGGLGLSGSGCGALGAVMWKTTLELVKIDKWKYTLTNPTIEKIINEFYEASDYEMDCHKICGMRFNTIDEHSEYIKSGGCDKLMNALAQL
jgi:hypothetical protein